MYLFSFLLILIVLIIVLMAFVSLKMYFAFNSEEMPNYYLSFTWLNSLLEGNITKNGDKSLLTIFLFSKIIVLKNLNGLETNLNSKINYIRKINPHYIKVYASYGFEDPSITGMTLGVLDFVSEYISINDLDNNPNFNSDSDYFIINAIIKINILFSLLRLVKTPNHNSNIPILNQGK